MPRKKTPDYGLILTGRLYDEDKAFVQELLKGGRKTKGEIVREAIHALRKARQQKGVVS